MKTMQRAAAVQRLLSCLFILWSIPSFAQSAENEPFKPEKLDEVIALSSREIELHPTDRGAWALRSAAWLQKRDIDRAVADFDMAISIDPSSLSSMAKPMFGRLYPKYIALAQNGDAKAAYGISELLRWRCTDVKTLIDTTITPEKCAELSDEWLERSAGQGFVSAQASFGKYIYEKNLSVDFGQCVARRPDVEKARVWLKRAADQLDTDAMFQLARTYLSTSENCSFQDHLLTIYWYEKTIARLKELGQTGPFYDNTRLILLREQMSTGQDFLEGKYVPQNYQQALRWLSIAAMNGSPGAQHRLGMMYLNGVGIAREDVEALKWFILAAPKTQESAQMRDRLNAALTPVQVGEAQRRAAAWTTNFEKSEWHSLFAKYQ